MSYRNRQNVLWFTFTMFCFCATFYLLDLFLIPGFELPTAQFAALEALAGVLQFFCLYYFFSVPLTGPGYVPQRAVTDEQVPARHTNGLTIERAGAVFQLKYCHSCRVLRPPRAVHCSLCKRCVLRFDHHCPWLGSCVGMNNYLLFYKFVLSAAALSVFCAALCVVSLSRARLAAANDIRAVFARAWPALLLVLELLLFGWFVVGLLVYHTYLILKNKTTYESIKGDSYARNDPWDQGKCINLLTTLHCEAMSGFTPGTPTRPDSSALP